MTGRCLTRRDRRSPAESPGGSGIPPRQRYLFLWGPLVAAGSVLNQAFPNQSAVIWYGIDTAGFICDCFEPLPRWDARVR
jgi:hypothetical protein